MRKTFDWKLSRISMLEEEAVRYNSGRLYAFHAKWFQFHYSVARSTVSDGGTASCRGGYLWIHWIGSRGEITRGGPPVGLTSPHRKKYACYESFTRSSTLTDPMDILKRQQQIKILFKKILRGDSIVICLLPFGLEPSLFSSAVEMHKNIIFYVVLYGC
jgi:hypothetical protein